MGRLIDYIEKKGPTPIGSLRRRVGCSFLDIVMITALYDDGSNVLCSASGVSLRASSTGVVDIRGRERHAMRAPERPDRSWEAAIDWTAARAMRENGYTLADIYARMGQAAPSQCAFMESATAPGVLPRPDAYRMARRYGFRRSRPKPAPESRIRYNNG